MTDEDDRPPIDAEADAIAVLDRETSEILDVDGPGEELFGLPGDEVVGRSLPAVLEVVATTADDVADVRRLLGEISTGDRATARVALAVETEGEGERTLELRLEAAETGDGRPGTLVTRSSNPATATGDRDSPPDDEGCYRTLVENFPNGLATGFVM